MTWYPTRVLPSLIVAGFALGCAAGRASREASPPPEPPPPPPSASTVSIDEPARAGSKTLEQMLAGRISGVTVTPAPGGGIIVRMVGPTSFYSREDPLFVVDGMPVTAGPNGTLSWLNPHDVESITALKDPSQTAIYGIRGANGVIVIKTKNAN